MKRAFYHFNNLVTLILFTGIAQNSMAETRDLAAEVSFTTNFTNFIKDESNKVDYSNSSINLSWVPIIWRFQAGLVLTSSTTEYTAPYELNNRIVQLKLSETKRGAGFRAKFNFADLNEDMVIPWIGASASQVWTQNQSEYNLANRIVQDIEEKAREEIVTDIGATIFLNNNVGISLSFARQIANKREKIDESQSEDKAPIVLASEQERVNLGISTFF